MQFTANKFMRHIYLLLLGIICQEEGRGGSRAAATSKMERFVIIVNGWK